jgi:hypothetical protein
MYILTHTYTRNSLKYVSHSHKVRIYLSMCNKQKCRKSDLYLQKFMCTEFESTRKISNLIYNDNIHWIDTIY